MKILLYTARIIMLLSSVTMGVSISYYLSSQMPNEIAILLSICLGIVAFFNTQFIIYALNRNTEMTIAFVVISTILFFFLMIGVYSYLVPESMLGFSLAAIHILVFNVVLPLSTSFLLESN